MIKKLTILFLCMAGLLCYYSYSQDNVNTIKQNIAKAEKEIRDINALIDKFDTEKKNTQARSKLGRAKIAARKKIIDGYNDQIDAINASISEKNNSVASLGGELASLKTSYAAMVVDSYKNYKTNNYLLFLFSAKDFQDMSRRIYYLKRFGQIRERKVGAIDSLRAQLGVEISGLHQQQQEVAAVLAQKNQEVATLAKEEAEYKRMEEDISKQQKALKEKARKNEKLLADLQKKLSEAMAAQIRSDRSRTVSAADVQKNAELSSKFDQNMGRLPFPVRGGVIVDRYGMNYTGSGNNKNPGVNISTPAGAEVLSIFDGEVSAVIMIPGDGRSNVLVRHGEYYSFYCYMAGVSVKKGDKVKTGQSLGMVAADGEGGYTLHFELKKGTQELNPELWLQK